MIESNIHDRPNPDKPESNFSQAAVSSKQSAVCSQDDFYESIFIFVHNPPPAGYIFVEKFINAIKNSLGVQCFFESMQQFNKTTSINVCTTIFCQLLQEY